MLKRIFLIIFVIFSIISSLLYNYTIKVYDSKYSIFTKYIYSCAYNGTEKQVSYKKKVIIGEILIPKYIHNQYIISSNGKVIDNIYNNFDKSTLIPIIIADNYFILESISSLIDKLYNKYHFKYIKININYSQVEIYAIYNNKELILCFDNLKLDPRILIYRHKHYDILNLYNYIDCRFDKYMIIKKSLL